MRAIIVEALGAPEDLAVQDVPAPALGAAEVRIAVRAAGCNFSDILMMKGEYQVKPPLPFIPGGEVGGVVLEVGSEVSGFSVGDRVLSRCALGGMRRRSVRRRRRHCGFLKHFLLQRARRLGRCIRPPMPPWFGARR
ncbi:MAG: alcohol dehydrogenase catalytic domain-containing protein [Myxococcota bacterium]